MARDFYMPKHIISGKDALSSACLSLGKKALIVSDPVMIKLGNINKIEKILDLQKVDHETFCDIIKEPTDLMIRDGAKKYKESGCDFLIAIGGGSSIDAAKAIGVVVSSNKDIDDYLGKTIDVKIPPLVAIPTTAGTGSEATKFTIINNTKENIKMLLTGEVLIPSLAIIDPEFTLSAPKQVTAATGLDALCHAIESYISKKAQPLSKTFSVSALKRILKYLPVCYENGLDIKAREEMSLAALEAGIAFNNSSVTIIHGMSRPIGALYHIAHGLSNAMLVKECLSFVLDGDCYEFATLAKESGIALNDDDIKTASLKLFDEIKKLISFCHIKTLSEYGIDKQDFINNIPKMAKDAMDSGSPSNTIKTCTIKDIENIYLKVINE